AARRRRVIAPRAAAAAGASARITPACRAGPARPDAEPARRATGQDARDGAARTAERARGRWAGGARRPRPPPIRVRARVPARRPGWRAARARVSSPGSSASIEPFPPGELVTSEDFLAVVRTLEGAGVVYWLDGGGGVDALLGRQTRPHGDPD